MYPNFRPRMPMPINPVKMLPQYKQIMQYVNDNGGDAKAAFYKKAKELGVDPEDVLSQLR